ncbi:hypothetical protein C8R45DRAFT_1090279 [Mycena sanguinolenta]|nr:hypothetical protein C8R45DRAFT_1090279 [Mycena sanguinolenta]
MPEHSRSCVCRLAVPTYLATVHWPIPLFGFTTGVLGALVQAFLVFRYWQFTRKTVITMFLDLAIIISFGSLCTNSVMLMVYISIADRPKLTIPIEIWFITEVAVDAGITSVLLWEFRQAKGIPIRTPGALNRLIAVTIQSGAAAATLAAAGLMGNYIRPDAYLSLVCLFPLARVYVITLLSNLNVRKSGNSPPPTGTSSGLGTWALTTSATDDADDVHHSVYSSVPVVPLL